MFVKSAVRLRSVSLASFVSQVGAGCGKALLALIEPLAVSFLTRIIPYLQLSIINDLAELFKRLLYGLFFTISSSRQNQTEPLLLLSVQRFMLQLEFDEFDS